MKYNENWVKNFPLWICYISVWINCFYTIVSKFIVLSLIFFSVAAISSLVGENLRKADMNLKTVTDSKIVESSNSTNITSKIVESTTVAKDIGLKCHKKFLFLLIIINKVEFYFLYFGFEEIWEFFFYFGFQGIRNTWLSNL